ncbi:MAG TPA: imidazole glycerol phosphate synthase subunit HisH [Bacteroidetes bacterium]|nr:imidazole glycerol phosphate synthase subunit HisH [Bacteroidota bacterium]
MNVVIIQYNAGNIRSVDFALRRLGVKPVISADPGVIASAEKVIFPGVGEAAGTMAHLRETGLARLIPSLKQDFLGICLGMQLMCSFSEEGNVPCLNIIPQKVKRFEAAGGLKVPHMGWNRLERTQGRLIDSSFEGEYMYFVHSYYVETGDFTTAIAVYGTPFSAAAERDNFFATQFHPEKSGTAGSRLLKKFIAL